MEQTIKHLSDAVRTAADTGRPLRIRGGGTKDFYGGALAGDVLDLTPLDGIVDYEPTELVITARSGTRLTEIENVLREKNQMLAFEPPHFGVPPPPLPYPSPASGGGNEFKQEREGVRSPCPFPPSGGTNGRRQAPASGTATIGGCVATGLSGPRRASAGSVRDFVLGVRVLDGRGDSLRFGGQVMKNVAGYDVSRLMAGSLGTLGVLLDVSLKVLPLPPVEITLRLQKTAAEAIALMNEWAGKPLPVSATCHVGNQLTLRLSGTAAAVKAARARLGGDEIADGAAFWRDLREQQLSFFAQGKPLWRLSLKPTTPPLNLPGAQLIEWAGALRWLAADADATTVRDAAIYGGGHATLFRGGDKSAGVFQPLPAALAKIHRNLKQAFDPAGIFNRGRMYDWM